MQTLYHKKKGAAEKGEALIPRKVYRSWTEKTTTIHLFADGTYGFMSGEPVSTEETLNIIKNPAQRKAAQAWWNSKGKKLAEGSAAAAVPVTDTPDTVLYYRYEGKRTKEATADTWMGYGFPGVPDWWGRARIIELDGIIYEKASEEPQTSEAKPEKKKAAEEF